MAYNYWLLSDNYGLLWDIVAYYFGLLGVPGIIYIIGVLESRIGGSMFWILPGLWASSPEHPSTQAPKADMPFELGRVL